jgi:hypothetical protein
MKHSCHFIVCGVIFLMSIASPSAFAVRLAPSSSSQVGKGAAGGPLLPVASSGVIASIDIAQQSIKVGNATYMFVPSLTKVYSVDPLINGNPLRLKAGQTIDFTIITDAAGKQRIADITVKKR